MKLSVSVRIAEGFLSKEIPILAFDEVVSIAKSAGYDAICMRASQVGIQSSQEQVDEASELLRQNGMGVSMVTGDFDTVYNNDNGPNALRNIEPYIALAQKLDASLVRVAIKKEEDIAAAQAAAEIAAKANIRLVHQCHTLSLFETVDQIIDTLKRIDRPNFGLIYEPANLELCGENYVEAIERLKPWIFNVYLQNQLLKDDGAVTLDTWCRGPSSFDIIPIHLPGGIDFPAVLRRLLSVGYDGMVTVHQSAPEDGDPLESTSETANYLRSIITKG